MIVSFVMFVLSLVLFLAFQAQGIYTGDSGDLVIAAYIGGVPHPPGYPLYTLLGFLLSKLPFFSVSWRLSLLSSIPHAMSVGLVFLLIYYLTKKNTWAALFGSLLLLSNYLFFLYSTTPEVFAMFDLFILACWFLLYRWQETWNFRYFYYACFVFGLSLTHHHVMAFFVPAFSYFIWKNTHAYKKKLTMRRVFLSILSFLVGLLPYAYVPVAAVRDTIINWDRAVDLSGFVRLVTRADYGTFVSGGGYGETLVERWFAVVAYANFLVTDWSWVGITLTIVGLWALYKTQRIWFWSWVIALLCVGPLFFFYASFPLASRFTLGTYERFLLPSYVLMGVASGIGLGETLRIISGILTPRLTLSKRKAVMVLVFLTFLIYPLTISGITLWRFVGLPKDRTADNMGIDILENTAPGAILLMSQDTALFTTQYVRYALGVRPDTAVIHAVRLPIEGYQASLTKSFPHLVFPKASPATYVEEFVKANRTQSQRIYSNVILPAGEGWYWVPRGMLYEAVPFAELPSDEVMYQDAKAHLARLHDPRSGILGRYEHLMLSDVLDVYGHAAIALGKTLVRADRWEDARVEFTRAVSYAGDTSIGEALELLGLTHLHFKDCDAALRAFREAKERSIVISPRHIMLESVTFGECVGDEKRASELFSEYERLRSASEQSLEAL